MFEDFLINYPQRYTQMAEIINDSRVKPLIANKSITEKMLQTALKTDPNNVLLQAGEISEQNKSLRP